MRPTCLGVVVVLHRMEANQSRALQSLSRKLTADDQDVFVVVQDNSDNGSPFAVPAIVDDYVTRPDNPGLAPAYDYAAERSAANGAEWLMLLDQDTEVSREYLDAVLAIARSEVTVPTDIGVLLPTLHDGGHVVSPHRRVRLRTRPLRQGTPGPVDEWCTYLNSGSTLRLAAVEAVGGFPSEYPLDYLDHVMAARLQAAGWRPWLLGSTLEHRLSLLDRKSLSGERLRSVLEAEDRYHLQYGTRSDLAWLSLRRWLGVVLSAVHLRSTPSLTDESAAARRATRRAVRRRPEGSHA